jgi:ABC-2 type transport system ATP-binding protein
MTKRKPKGPADPGPVLVTEGLMKSYDDLVALAPLDLSVTAGQLVAVLGHNGSGKSTLLQLLAGLLDPTGGSASIAGEPAGSRAARAAVSYLGDTPVLYDDLSVWEHLEYLARLHGTHDWEHRSQELLDRFNLADRADELPIRHSRGLRQKTALTIGLVRPAQLLLIDEPFVGLDAQGKQALVQVLDERRSGGTTVLLATHDLDVLEQADRCVVLHDGAVVHDGKPEPSAAAGLAR